MDGYRYDDFMTAGDILFSSSFDYLWEIVTFLSEAFGLGFKIWDSTTSV